MSYSNHRPDLPINSKGLFLPIDPERLVGQDQTLSLSGMKWEDYEQITKNSNGYRISYFEGIITTVYPSQSHEVIEQTISILINAYCRKYHKLYFPMGSFALRCPCTVAKEPDVSYAFDTAKSFPDLSVEVVFSSGGTADLIKYYYLGANEVWFWQNEQIKFYQLIDDRYIEAEFSSCLKNLSSEFLIEFINRGLTESPLTIEADFVARLDSQLASKIETNLSVFNLISSLYNYGLDFAITQDAKLIFQSQPKALPDSCKRSIDGTYERFISLIAISWVAAISWLLIKKGQGQLPKILTDRSVRRSHEPTMQLYIQKKNRLYSPVEFLFPN